MSQELNIILEELKSKLKKVSNLFELNELRVSFLGKKGKIQEKMSLMSSLDSDAKKEFGVLINNLKEEVTNLLEEKKSYLEKKEIEDKLNQDKIDISLPGTIISKGSKHPLTQIIEEVEELFISMGYDVVMGPEIEKDLYNFEKLNLPKNHPARDSQDSFYLTEEYLLRTQTSPVQARTMENNIEKGPIRIICPGKVYRRDNDDATHSHQFHQIEGLVIDKDISLAHLKGTLEVFAKRMFGNDREIRFRPSFFPFTEPSIEVDVSCFKCGSKGCSLCKNTGWIEILGAGMVHPNVLKAGGYDPDEYRGFAFGMGPERIAMLKYGISDIRHFYLNDIRFLNDFNRTEGGETDEN
jgi:phenylalanyl-tRNA synthetase alpha chain